MSATIAANKPGSARYALHVVGTVTGPAALAVFGAVLWYYQANENIFTFAAWGTLDLVIGISMYKAGSTKEAVLPLAYGVTALFVVAMIYQNGKWDWTFVETICLAGTALAFYCWYRMGPTAAVIAAATAMTIASIPLIRDNYYNPQTWEWWLWVGGGISAVIGMYLSRPWRVSNIADWLFVACSTAISIILTYLTLIAPLWKQL